MRTVYPALVEKEKKSDYCVYFPDLPGCITAADTAEEAMLQAEEALAFHLEGMLEDGDDLPLPTDWEQFIKAHAAHKNTFPILVTADVSEKKQRINIMIRETSLRTIDTLAEEIGMTRSAFIETASTQLASEIRAKRIHPTDKPSRKAHRPR